MRTTKIISLLLLCLLLVAQAASLQIYYVSSLPSTVKNPVSASLRGGTMLYIKAIGHNPMASGNKIFVGIFPCIIPSDGVSDTFIACETTDTGSDTNINNMPVTIISSGTSFTTSYPNTVYFDSYFTPYLYELFPASGFANSQIILAGNHRITNLGDGQRDMGDVTKILLGRHLCSRFDIEQDAIAKQWSYAIIKCAQSHLMEGGNYNVSEQVVYGLADRHTFLRRSSLVRGEYFEFTALPTVSGVSTHRGNNGGQTLSITGTGFSLNKKNNTVQVDGNNCKVTYSDEGTIKCILDPRNATLTTKLPSTSTSQTNGYISGAGIKYARYGYATTIAELVTAVRGNNVTALGTPLQVGYRAELREGDAYGTSYSQTWNGYFTAPVSGEYTFTGNADDAFSFYLATVTGSTELPASPLIYSNWAQSWNDFYMNNRPTATATITLQAGQSYYFQAYHINWQGAGSFRVEVSVPNTDTSLSFQTFQVDEIFMNSTIQPEVVVYTMSGATSGTFNLRIYRPPVGTTAAYDVNVDVTYGCTADEFKAALNNFDYFEPYAISVVREIYDSSNTLVTDLALAAKINYIVSFVKLRTPDIVSKSTFIYTKNTYNGAFTPTPLTRSQHSPLVSGTWSLSIGGVTVDPNGDGSLPYNAASTAIQSFLRSSLVGFQDVEVSRWAQYDCEYSCSWFIKYKNYNNQTTTVSPNSVGLSGGVGMPSIIVRTRRNYSSNVLFNPIDYRFLSVPSNTANVIVKTNGVPSICTGDCSYVFGLYSEVTSLSINGTVLSLAISDPTSQGFIASDVKVTVQGKTCTVDITKPISALTCQLPTNGDSSLALVASNSVAPMVWVKDFGIAALASGVTPISVSLIVNAPAISSGGTNGGYVISLTGNGFPTNTNEISITLCSAAATIKSSTSTQVDFYVPKCATQTSQTITVKVGTVTDTSRSFTYTAPAGAPTVISLSPTSANPGVKGVLEVNGLNFGTDALQLKVFLSNSSGKVYQLNILSSNDTYLQLGLSGGLAGAFTLQVNKAVAGDSVPATAGADQFNYIVSIQSISPVSGSYYGGTLLTITGQNFATDTQQTLAFVGSTLNWFCSIQSITPSTILCRTPAISEDYNPGDPQPIVVTTRLIVESQCTGTCAFTYLTAADSPSLTNLTTSSGVATLTGTSFTSGSSCSVSLTNTVTQTVTVLPASSCSATTAVFTISATIISGKYNVKVRSEKGESNPMQLTVGWNSGSQNTWSGSTAGALVTFSSGSGYPTDLSNKQFSVTIKDGNNVVSPANVVSCCSGNSITILMPPAADTAFFTINFAGPTGSYKAGDYIAYAVNTGALSLVSPSALSVGVNSITLNITKSVTNPIASIMLVSRRSADYTIPVTNWTTNGTQITFSVQLTTGSFKFAVRGASLFYTINDVVNVAMPTNIISTAESYSYNGGTFTIAASSLSPVSNIRVNGLKGALIDYNKANSSATYEIPSFVTTLSQSTYNLAKTELLDLSVATFFSDVTTNSNVRLSFDGLSTTYYSSPNATCWIGIDFGTASSASISRMRVFPNLNWVNTASKILDATFEGSNDGNNWNTLATVDQTIHSGWNTLASSRTTPYRYIRFSHTNVSKCNIAEIQLYGIVYSNANPTDLTSQPSDIVYEDGYNTYTFPGNATYTAARTAIVTSFSPKYGDIFGGYTLNITGTNLGFNTPTVVIDGIVCANPTYDSATSSITCLVGARPNIPASSSLVVMIGNSAAILRDTFYYVLRWSDKRTWGTDLPPIDGDLISIPAGMTLLVDQDTPNLRGIAVSNGTIIFSDEKDLTINTGFITIVGGRFIAGTQQAPHQHRLDFILHGDYYDTQMPMFGNKGIGCMECKFSMYGRPRTPTWTTISATISPGNLTFSVQQDVDWQAGEEIVVASTSFSHWEAERRKIVSVSANRTITVDSAFKFTHVHAVQTYGSTDRLPMIAEVGLLTRNIKMRGDDASTMIREYGSHLMIMGQSVNGAEGHIAYSEFTQCGQPAILGRYCIHFHMMGDVPTSFVRGNAVHDSLARVVTIHGVHYLTVENNVGYRVRGHNFFVEDGIETHNVIRNNLAIGSLVASNMLQTDTSVASFWVTNPSNDFYGNHAAGSDFYGIWYEIKPNPDGPSATNDVCPTGNPLGSVHDNVAHSNVRFGLRIFQLQSRRFPCEDIRDDSNGTDPWFSNPSITSLFTNFVLYKNMEDGLLAEQTGNAVFQNFSIGESYHSGVQFYLSNFTREPPTVANSFIVGQSFTNAASDTTNYTSGMSGAITSRSGVTKLDNIRFYNFPPGSVLLQTCRLCDDVLKYTNVGTEVIVNRLTLTNVTGKLLFMIGLKRDVIYDLDGSLSYAFDQTTRASGTIVHGFPHIASSNPTLCPQALLPSGWDGAVMCGPTVTLRRAIFTNLAKHQDFAAQNLRATEISSVNDTVPATLDPVNYTMIYSTLPFTTMEPKKEKPYTWAIPFITGRVYNIWWGSGIDFTHLSVYTSHSFVPADKGIIFKFNYSENRESYRIGPMVGKVPLVEANYKNKSESLLDPDTCKNGDYYHDNNDNTSLRMLNLCQSGKDKALFEYTEVNGIVCQFVCPLPPGTFILEDFLRYWSNATQWPGGVIPQAGDNVTVKGEWRLVLDMDPNPINNLTIDGNLIADDSRDVNIVANFIFIRAGNFSAGSPTNPFAHKLNIQLNGAKLDTARVIDPLLTGNKFLVVTGSLNLYGSPPSTVIATLTETAFKNSTKVKVDDYTDWAVGDSITLAPSFSVATEYQTATISSIDTTTNYITLAAPLQYTHYGDSSVTVSSVHGNLDTRAKVGHISRNIKILAGPDSGWGFSIYIYGYTDTANVQRVGSAQLVGVQILNGGQLDSRNSPLVFKNLVGGNLTSKVSKSSFVNCKAFCINVDTANNITITSNVLTNAWVFGVQITAMKYFTFTNNVIIGVTGRPTVDAFAELVACFSALLPVDAANDYVKVTDNVCQGSVSHGWAVPHIGCGDLQTNPFANNTIGSAHIGFILNTISKDCQAFSYLKAYACDIGHICGSPNTKSVVFEHFVLADNGRGATLKMGAAEGRNNHTAYLRKSYVTPVSRPNCPYCYGASATNCVNNIGFRMFTASNNGQIMPAKFGSGFDVICKQPVYNSKAYIENVIFDGFKQDYSGTPVASICGRNFAFRPHTGAFDQVGGHYLTNCNCNNCDNNSYVLCDAPDPSMLGWFGGCGDILCTGKNNYQITDWTGGFLGAPATIIGNNSVIGDNEPNCTYSSSMNGHLCTRTDFATLEYQSISPDFNKRIMWPVNLTYDGSNYTTRTNGWREWEWLGKQPQNQRFGRFVSIVNLFKTYNMSFAAIPPHNLQLQLQTRTHAGNNSNYIIVKLYYPLPNSIKLTVNNVVVKPLLLTNYNNGSSLLSTLNRTQCGSNIYFYNNNTIEFVLTEAADCTAVVSLVDSITLTTHFSMDINSFFSSSAITNFINNLCALLQITDTSRVKVVGVFSGSTIVNAVIDASSVPANTTVSNSTSTSDPSSLTAINDLLNSHITNGTFASTMTGNVGPVQTVTSTINYLNPPSDEGKVNLKMIIGVAVGGTVLTVIVIVGIMWMVRKRSKVAVDIVSEESLPHEPGEKDSNIFHKEAIHPEQSNIMLRNQKTTTFEVKDVEE